MYKIEYKTNKLCKNTFANKINYTFEKLKNNFM